MLYSHIVKLGTAGLTATVLATLCFCPMAAGAVNGTVAASTPNATVYPEANGTYRVITHATRSRLGAAPDATPGEISEEEVLTECTLWSNEPTTNECLNLNSPELVGYGEAPKNAVGRGKETTPIGTFRYLQYYELDQEELPLGSQVLEATQSEYLNSATKKQSPIPVGLYGLTAPWAMNTTWEKASGTKAWRTPGGDYNTASDVIDPAVGGTNGWVSWNVKPLVQEWANRESIAPGRPDYGFILADAESPAKVQDVLSFENAPEQEGYMEYRVEPDVTPPTKPEGFYGAFEESTGQTFVSWNPSTDPAFPDGYHGSGVAGYTYRYQLNGGAWTSWQSTTTTGFSVSKTTLGEKIGLEIKSYDLANNESATVKATLTAEVSKLTAENIGETAPSEKGEAPLYPEPEETEGATAGAETEPVGPTKFTVTPDSEPYKESLCGSKSSPCGTYSGGAASAYAQRWLNANQSIEESYFHRNRAYNYYGGNGGDCTNFVSQALKAGGMEYMRAHGDNNPNGFETPTLYPDETFLKGEGSWWSYYEPLPVAYDYTTTTSFVRAHTLYEHLVDTKLGRSLKGKEQVKPGDIVFFDLEHYGVAPSEVDHAELVTRLTGTETVVAQHSPNFEHSLRYVINQENSKPGKNINTNWHYVIVEPTGTAADIYG